MADQQLAPVSVSELVQEKQLAPSFAARVFIPAGENVLVGFGLVMLAAVAWADWAALVARLPDWLVAGLRIATAVTGILFIIRFGADEIRMLVGIFARERAAREDKAKDAFIERLQHENSLLRAAMANKRNYTPTTTVQPETPVDDALTILNRLKNGVLPRVSERTVVERQKMLSVDRYKAAVLVMRQAGILFDRQGVYLGMMVNGEKQQGASLDAAIAAIHNKHKGEQQ